MPSKFQWTEGSLVEDFLVEGYLVEGSLVEVSLGGAEEGSLGDDDNDSLEAEDACSLGGRTNEEAAGTRRRTGTVDSAGGSTGSGVVGL